MPSFEVCELHKDEFGAWDEFIQRSSSSTVYHRSNWLVLCSEVLELPFHILGCYRKNQLVGGWPFFTQERLNGFLRMAHSTCEQTPYGGIVLEKNRSKYVGDQERHDSLIIKELCTTLLEQKFDFIEIVQPPGFKDIRPFLWTGWEDRVLYTYCLSLQGDIDATFPTDLKKRVRKAQSSGVTIRNEEDPAVHYKIHTAIYKAQGLRPPVKRLFFDRVLELFKKEPIGNMWVAEMPSGEIVSSIIALWDSNMGYLWDGGTDPEYRDTEVTRLIEYTICKDLQKAGISKINMTYGNIPRLARFISTFNPVLLPYYSICLRNWKGRMIRGGRYFVNSLKGNSYSWDIFNY